MRSSAKQGKIAAALLELRRNAGPVRCDASVLATVDERGFEFATLAAVVRHLEPMCYGHGIAYVQAPGKCETNPSGFHMMAVTTRLIHVASGEWIEDVTTWPVDGRAKPEVAAAVTQARKASLLALFGLVVEGELERVIRQKAAGVETFVNGKPAALAPAVEAPF